MPRIEITFTADLPDLVPPAQIAVVEAKVRAVLTERFQHEVSEAVGNIGRLDSALGIFAVAGVPPTP